MQRVRISTTLIHEMKTADTAFCLCVLAWVRGGNVVFEGVL
jgi:hypothetical protein